MRDVNGTAQDDQDKKAKATLREKIAKGEEAQVFLLNYKKSGEKFRNLLTTIPITWDEGDTAKRYIVGFQVDSKTVLNEIEM
jgi:hypothetical protein